MDETKTTEGTTETPDVAAPDTGDGGDLEAEIVAELTAAKKAAAAPAKEEDSEEEEGEKAEKAEPAKPEDEEAEKPAEAEPEAPAEEDDPPPVSKGLAAIARKDKALRLEQAKFKTEREQWSAKVAAAEEFTTRWQSDPAGALRSVVGDLDPAKADALAKDIWYQAHPELTPSDYADTKRVRSVETQMQAELRKMQEELRSVRQHAESQTLKAQIESYVGNLRGAIKVASGDLEFLQTAIEVQGDDAVARNVYEMGEAHFAELREEDPEAAPPTYEQLAQLANERLKKKYEPMLNRLLARRSGTKTKQPVAEETKPAKTLTNEHNTQTKPRFVPQTDEDLEAEIIADLKAMKA